MLKIPPQAKVKGNPCFPIQLKNTCLEPSALLLTCLNAGALQEHFPCTGSNREINFSELMDLPGKSDFYFLSPKKSVLSKEERILKCKILLSGCSVVLLQEGWRMQVLARTPGTGPLQGCVAPTAPKQLWEGWAAHKMSHFCRKNINRILDDHFCQQS